MLGSHTIDAQIDGKIIDLDQDPSMFRRITSMEPLLPASGSPVLAELSVEIFRNSGELVAALPSKAVRCGIAALVREMNSYYSNLIEGHKTLPCDIERALRDDFSDREEDRRNQLLSVAHIRTETAMRQRLEDELDLGVFEPQFVQWLHRELHGALPEAECFTTSVSGKRYPLAPGEFRSYNLDVSPNKLGEEQRPDSTGRSGYPAGKRGSLARRSVAGRCAGHHHCG